MLKIGIICWELLWLFIKLWLHVVHLWRCLHIVHWLSHHLLRRVHIFITSWNTTTSHIHSHLHLLILLIELLLPIDNYLSGWISKGSSCTSLAKRVVFHLFLNFFFFSSNSIFLLPLLLLFFFLYLILHLSQIFFLFLCLIF